jgi:hypothetical protein
MTLREALINQEIDEVDDVIDNMVNDVLAGTDPEYVLEEYGLEPDYVMDLLDLCNGN